MEKNPTGSVVEPGDRVLAVNDQSVDMLPSPFFLVGAERSGTTLTRLMFDSHPLIAFFFEFEYSVDMMPEAQGWPDLREYHEFLRPDRIFQAANVVINEGARLPASGRQLSAAEEGSRRQATGRSDGPSSF